MKKRYFFIVFIILGIFVLYSFYVVHRDGMPANPMHDNGAFYPPRTFGKVAP